MIFPKSISIYSTIFLLFCQLAMELTQDDLAGLMGVTQQRVSKIESSDSLNVRTLERTAGALGHTLVELLSIGVEEVRPARTADREQVEEVA